MGALLSNLLPYHRICPDILFMRTNNILRYKKILCSTKGDKTNETIIATNLRRYKILRNQNTICEFERPPKLIFSDQTQARPSLRPGQTRMVSVEGP